MKFKHISILNYIQDIKVNKAKKLLFPSIRGTYIPSVDIQTDFGIAVNWFGKRVRVSLGKRI